MLMPPIDFHTFNRSRLDTISKYFSTIDIEVIHNTWSQSILSIYVLVTMSLLDLKESIHGFCKIKIFLNEVFKENVRGL